jgi:hypothetical protein
MVYGVTVLAISSAAGAWRSVQLPSSQPRVGRCGSAASVVYVVAEMRLLILNTACVGRRYAALHYPAPGAPAFTGAAADGGANRGNGTAGSLLPLSEDHAGGWSVVQLWSERIVAVCVWHSPQHTHSASWRAPGRTHGGVFG